MKLYPFRAFLPLLILLSVSSGLACSDTTIDPFENEDKYFTIWGYLDQLSSSHQLRVIPVTRFPENVGDPALPENRIDATVYSVDLTTGNRTRWSYEIAELEDGSHGHVFKSHFVINPKRSYRIEVVRSDGKMTTATTRVMAIDSDTLIVKDPVVWSVDSTDAYQDIYIPQIASPWEVQARYIWVGGDQEMKLLIPYGRPGVRTPDGGWKLRINVSADQVEVKKHTAWAQSIGMIPPSGAYSLRGWGVQIRILDENWDPPNGVFDPEVLAQPGVLSNVENGYGFFGSIGLYTEAWSIDRKTSRALGHPY